MRFSWFKPFRVVAILAVRNEQHHVRRCLQHLSEQEIHAVVIDNGSTDGTRDIIESFKGSVVIQKIPYPYAGYFDWEGLLKLKESLARSIRADWILHLDADEIPESPFPGITLRGAFRKVGLQGFNAVNFNEFVFPPLHDGEDWSGRDYVAGMKHYYFYEPRPQRLVRAWKCGRHRVDLAPSGGHEAQFPGRRIYPQPFALRHYIALSAEHFRTKYGNRIFAPDEVARGWHYNRINIADAPLSLPEPTDLEIVRENGGWVTDHPKLHHFFEPAP